MELSLFLAKVIGLYLVLMCAGIWLRRNIFHSIVDEFLASKSLWIFSTGFILILGLILTTVHNLWVTDWRILITLISWWILINGLARLLFEDHAKRLIRKVSQSEYLTLICAVFFVIGIILTYFGFWSVK